ncbi:MAG: ABC transporter permease [Proteobacteria bacterium]|jgi:NitT/TauT family transport system permease protein|nr:ABC transporter permease [Pseudomonadota bacterium]MDA1300347.1 ABC transporter permease [Pseudomonadota bacterium]
MRVINRQPRQGISTITAAIPLVLLMIVYMIFSEARLAENPDDKLLPGVGTMVDAVQRMAFEPNKRTGDYLLWADTQASLSRLGIGMSISALIGLCIGVLNGVIPWFSAFWSPSVRIISMIPPMAILPILFILFGLGELSKYVLIIVGTAPFIMRDMEQRVRELPREQIIKAQTLDATSWQLIVRVVLPQVMPRLLDSVRLSLGSAWLFLIAAEAIASTEGLGYRIFLVRRYLSMDVILPYVIWITLLALIIDFSLRRVNAVCFPWFGANR